jgi:glutamate N-acetyltransferase/amino-acid N-acetyltransferase
MTTDTHPKEYGVSYQSFDPSFKGETFTIGGMVKGSGMIEPHMATLIAVLTTDAPLEPGALHQALTTAMAKSFNKVTVDSDTSTNDTCYLMASGKATCSPDTFSPHTPAFAEFCFALDTVCINLARQIAADGEGATKLITVQVKGAQNDHDADLCARAIANSPLVKTAIFGSDANWGRISMAIGKSGAFYAQGNVSITLMDILLLKHGLPVIFDEEEAKRRLSAPEITIDVDLGAGNASTKIWTCDLTHEYISINADYRS